MDLRGSQKWRWIASHRRAIEVAVVLLIIGAAIGRRLEYLTSRAFWVDEAESSINAQTILEHGVPTDRYLGLPIYENTLVKPWPGNPEYEFRDISYSDRGLATYHGWLPLYSIAASIALDRIFRHRDIAGNDVSGGLEEFKRRTFVARLPSVLFSALFLVLCYWGGICLLGRDAGLTALLVGFVHQTRLDVATTARYYSATVALSTGALLCLWLVLKKESSKYYALAAGVFTLLFYTHLVTFAAAVLVAGVVGGYLLWKGRTSPPKLLLFAGILASGTLPWIFATGFLSGLGAVPPARLLLSFPQDLFTFAVARPVYFMLLGAALLVMLWVYRRRQSRRLDGSPHPLQRYLAVGALLCLWIVMGYLSFILLIPAASFFPERINLSYWGPELLLGSVFCAAVARIFAKRFSLLAAPLLALLLLALTGHDLRAEPSPDEGHSWHDLVALTTYLDQSNIPSTTKLYASPNDHLVLTFYTGRPFQSIAPVRKSFLDAYRGNILYVERAVFPAISPMSMDADPVATRAPLCASVQAQECLDLVRTRSYRRYVNEYLTGASGQSDQITTLQEISADLRQSPHSGGSSALETIIPILRGYRLSSAFDWRAAFFYRFVNPASRIGRNTNYAARMGGSKCDLLTNADWAVYHFRSQLQPATASVEFHLLP